MSTSGSVPRWAAQVWLRPAREEDAFLPEGPRYFRWQGRDAVIWVNIQTSRQADRGRLMVAATEAEGPAEVRSFDCPGRPGFVLPTDRDGVVLVGIDHCLCLFDLEQQVWSRPLAHLPQAHPRTTINDGEVTPDGRAIVFGTKDLLFREPFGCLYLYDVPQRRLHVLAEGQTCSNGKVIRQEAEGWILYDIDTPTRQVRRYRLDIEGGQAQFLDVALDWHGWEEFPDGMCAADDQSVIIAFYHPGDRDGGRAVRFDLESREAVEEWEVPFSPRVTCPLLLPPSSPPRSDRARLILTTAEEGMPPEVRQRNPNAGCLFQAPTSLPAAPEPAVVRLGED
ncbi:MAG: SMP-30/gluconolactonase/LRE family protein [Gemmataceae bacterium]|nr:SMP-30/gluconolactonase/LRE family protein [Gemmataceae bacterium]